MTKRRHPSVFYWRGRWRDTVTKRILTVAEIDALNGKMNGKPRKYEAIGEYIIKHLPSRESMAINSVELHRRVVDDYGSINMRVFFRRLVDMRAAGELNFKSGEHAREIVYWRKR